jgi:hypothetical protein
MQREENRRRKDSVMIAEGSDARFRNRCKRGAWYQSTMGVSDSCRYGRKPVVVAARYRKGAIAACTEIHAFHETVQTALLNGSFRAMQMHVACNQSMQDELVPAEKMIRINNVV